MPRAENIDMGEVRTEAVVSVLWKEKLRHRVVGVSDGAGGAAEASHFPPCRVPSLPFCWNLGHSRSNW